MKCQFDLVTCTEEEPTQCDAEATHYNCLVNGAKVCEKHKCRHNVKLPAYMRADPNKDWW